MRSLVLCVYGVLFIVCRLTEIDYGLDHWVNSCLGKMQWMQLRYNLTENWSKIEFWQNHAMPLVKRMRP